MVWYVKTGPEDEGFKQNKVDPCLFVRNNCIVIFYVDDCCIFSKDKEKIDALLINISKAFKLTDDGGVKSYLGMNVSKDPNGTITMRQSANVILTKDFSVALCWEDEDQIGSVLSRTGYINKFANFPIVWVSRVQREIALLTTKAEYISLSQSMIDLIQLRYMMLDVSSVFGMKCYSCNSYTTTFEDNKGAIELTKEPKYRPWTKHIFIKWHYSLEHIKRGTSKIVYVETNEQQGNNMTKPLAKPKFEYLQKQIMVWWI